MNSIKKIFGVLMIMGFMPLISVAQNFQGVIEMTTNNKATKETGTVTWYLKNGSHRLDYNTRAEGKSYNYSLISKGSSVKFIITTGSEVVVSDVPVSAITIAPVVTPGYLRLSIETRTIAGVECTRVADEKNQTIAWVSNSAGFTLQDLPEFIRNAGPIKALQANNIAGVPLEMYTYDEEGKVAYSQTITSLKKGSVSDDKFTAPAGKSLQESIKVGAN